MVTGSELPLLWLVHWNADEAASYAERLQQWGYAVALSKTVGRAFLRELIQSPPAALVIVLERLPSQGRDLAVMVRLQASTRQIPIVFVGGLAQKVDPIRELLPDAVYTTWDDLAIDLVEAIARPPLDPVAPSSVFAAYAGRSLAVKLGLKPGMQVSLLEPPPGFTSLIDGLPAGVHFHAQITPQTDLVIWFVSQASELDTRLVSLAENIGEARLWICWPKKSARIVSDVTQNLVRQRGLAQGLVDYKITAIDQTWSGLLFTRRKN